MLDDHDRASEYEGAFDLPDPSFSPWSKGFIYGFLAGAFTALGCVLLITR